MSITPRPDDDDGLPPVPGDPLYYKLPPLPQDEPLTQQLPSQQEPPAQAWQNTQPQYGAPGTGYPPPYPGAPSQPPAQAFDRNGSAQANAWAGMTPEQAWAQHYQQQQQYPQQPWQQPQQYWQQPPAVSVAQAVTVNNRSGGGCPHMLHFVLTLLTCGMWLPIWIIHAIVDAFR